MNPRERAAFAEAVEYCAAGHGASAERIAKWQRVLGESADDAAAFGAPKASAEMFDVAMVEGLARAAELLEKKDGGTIWDTTSKEALDLARKIGIRGTPVAVAAQRPSDATEAQCEQSVAALATRASLWLDQRRDLLCRALRASDDQLAIALANAYVELTKVGA